jgi:aldehyde dehydrogenase (NAD+)
MNAVDEISTQTIDKQSIIQLFEAQKRYALKLKHSTAQDRKDKLKKLEDYITHHESALQEAIYRDFKKNPTETSLTEIFPTLVEIRHAISQVKSWINPKSIHRTLTLLTTSSKIVYEPKGVTLIISPWNYPFSLAINPLVSAISAGCTAIIKPSELTPHTSAFIKKMIQNIFQPEEIAVVEGAVETSTVLLDLPFDHIFFTGSPAVGKIVMRAASKHLASVTLELGGKSPVIIDETVDLKDVAEKLAWGKFVNAGQTCIAPDYIFVKKDLQDKLILELKAVLQERYNPNGIKTEESKDLARIINPKNFQRLKSLLENAIQKGAKVAFGGKTIAEECFIEPTLLTNLTPDMEMMQEEIFGPIFPILTYQTLPEALSFIQTLPKPLALYIFSNHKNNIDFIVKNSTAGGTCINDCLLHITHPDLPFGGVNNSGIGKSHGEAGFLEFSNARSVMRQKSGWTPIKLLYPPYTPSVQDMLDKLKKLL